MLNRALVLATVMLLIGCFAAAPAHAQATNLEAGKSPSQIFAGTCTVCHKSPRGLLKTMSAAALPGFLRQHYTTSPDMAGLLSSYLVSNGAADKRYQGKDAKSDGKPQGQPGAAPQLDRQGRPVHTSAPARDPAKPQAEQQPAAKPDSAAISPQDDGARKGRKRLARPAEEGAQPAEDETAVRQSGERGPDGRKLSAKQRLSKRGKPGEELPKGDAAKTDSGNEAPAASTATKEDRPAGEATKNDGAKVSDKPSDETAKVESPKETAPKAPAGQTPAQRADPLPAVTPAPAASPPAAAAPAGGPAEQAAGSSAPSAKPAAPAAASPPAQAAASEPAAAASPAPSSTPAASPQPPISR
ncbi:hypothetical protein [Bradyrhizobium sp. S69]|uniref:hypothetical protein n=1 Tax=Bradyrhizobium sp. S69 TaxID=1641856 RepID=UPI00131CEFA1|nr:hypothetical protein [Bradyrhizobium sp. S69]